METTTISSITLTCEDGERFIDFTPKAIEDFEPGDLQKLIETAMRLLAPGWHLTVQKGAVDPDTWEAVPPFSGNIFIPGGHTNAQGPYFDDA